MSELLIATLAGLGGMLGWGFADFFAKKTIDQIGDVVSMVWAHVFGTLAFAALTLLSVPFSGYPQLPDGVLSWLLLSTFGVLQACVYLIAYQGFGKGPLGILNPIFASYSGVAAVLSVLLLREVVSIEMIVVLLTVFVGILLMNLDSASLGNYTISIIPGVKEMILAALLAACWTVAWAAFIRGENWLVFAFVMYVFMTAAAYLVARTRKINLAASSIPAHVWKFLALIGVCEAVAYTSISIGFGVTSRASVVAVLSGAFSLPTIILARVFLKERFTRIQTLGSLVVIVGIAFMSAM